MTINEEQAQPGADNEAQQPGPGVLLSQAREARGWTQHEVARRLNLRVAVIESIDSDHYKAGVAMTFLRGYVKAYAKMVGVNEQQALQAFDRVTGHQQSGAAEVAPMQSFSKKTRQQASDKWLRRISWLVLIGLLASLVYWWWQNDEGGYGEASSPAAEQAAPAEDTEPAEAPVLIQPEPAPLQDAVEATPDVAEPADQSTDESAAPAEADTAPEPVPAEVTPEPVEAEPAVAAEAEPPVAADPGLLVLSFSDDCWIQITDAQGQVLSEGVKQAADRLELRGEPPFRLVLGAPQAASVEYLNQTVDLSSFRAGRVARLTVPQS